MLTGYMYAYAGFYDDELDTAMEAVMAENLKNQTIEKRRGNIHLINEDGNWEVIQDSDLEEVIFGACIEGLLY